MKTIKIYLILLIAQTTFAQKIVGFGGIGVYLNRSFERSSFYSINTGVEYNVNNYLKPEIKFEYFLGVVPDISTEFNNNNIETEFLERKISAANVSVSPKISFGEKDQTVHFQIIPMYNYTIIYASGSIYSLDQTKNIFVKTDSDSYSEVRHSLGIGVGLLINVNDDTFQAIAVELNYNNIDMGNALSSLKFDKDNFNTNQSLGLRIKYYFGISSKKQKNRN